MNDRISAVMGCGAAGCGQYVRRGDELGRVVDSVVIGEAEVWQIEWPDGGVYLLHTMELAGVRLHRPPDRPPSAF